MQPNGLLFNLSCLLQKALSNTQDKDLEPAARTAHRFLQELKTGQVKGRDSAKAAARLGIPTGEEVLIRRSMGARELVADLRRRDGGLGEAEAQRQHEAQMLLATSATQNAGQWGTVTESLEWNIDPILHREAVLGEAASQVKLDQTGIHEGTSRLQGLEDDDPEPLPTVEFSSMDVGMARLANLLFTQNQE
jgi:hypothetical protein